MSETRPVFLHTGWRSLGTWLWSAFREQRQVRAFYEPLHERLARIGPREAARFRPADWSSGHDTTEPYFAEYAGLLRPRGRGVTGYESRFAFDDFFAGPESEDPALQAYLQSLLDAAAREGRRPVLKFCRSLGRIAWLQARFPEALHLLVTRDPWPQWISGRLQLTQHHNQYFVQAPFVILARNRAHPLVASSIAALGVSMAPTLGRDLGLAFDTAERHVRRLDWAERYRGFLSFWAASSLAAHRAGAVLVDTTALTADLAYRAAMQARLRTETGMTLNLQPNVPAPSGAPLVHGAPERAAEAACRRLIGEQGGPDWLREKLGSAGSEPEADAGRRPDAGFLDRAAQHADAAIYVAAKRLSYPLRWLHGELNRRLLTR